MFGTSEMKRSQCVNRTVGCLAMKILIIVYVEVQLPGKKGSWFCLGHKVRSLINVTAIERILSKKVELLFLEM